MTLALLFALACDVHADQVEPEAPAPEDPMSYVEHGTQGMQEFEATVAMLPPDQLAEAHASAKTLTTTCPYNGASVQLMGTLIDQVPADSATREGVDSMARILAQLQLDGGAHSIDDTRMRLDRVDPAVQLLTNEETATIESSGAEMLRYTGVQWPPKGAYVNWKDQLRAEGHTELASLIELAMENRY
ncbi:MAG: hypothetical protein GY913_14515 [Proteobacteria bacterium]|nr:hypothetical protein [Pseudomonadota bacterium]MCP4918123.1 hypothetical protein [Pseudomonadota bacterium]